MLTGELGLSHLQISDSVRKEFTTTVERIEHIISGEFGKKKFGFTLPTTMDNIERSKKALISMIYKLVKRLRSFLDFMEPLHVRRFDSQSPQPLVLWGYSLSILKLEKEIGSLWPSLNDDLYFHRLYHLHVMRPMFLHMLDHMEILGDYFQVALWLNVWYEDLLAMDKDHMISNSAKDHLQSSLADRILHIYRSLFPTNTTVKALQREELENRAMQLSLFHLTTGLLPPHCRDFSMGHVAWRILRQQKTSIRSDGDLPSEKADPHCQKPPEHSFPMLKAYVPAQLFVILGLDTEPQNVSTDPQWMEHIEVYIREHLKTYDAKVQKEILDFSPYILSIGTKAVFNEVNKRFAEKGLGHWDRASWDCRGRELLHAIITMSIRYSMMLIACLELWSSLQTGEVTLAELVMENRDLEDKYFQVLSETSGARVISVIMSWASTLG
jgi:hypothetical protein